MKRMLVRIGKLAAIWIPTVLFAALFAMQGVMKLGKLEVWVERFRNYGFPEQFYLVIGVLELGGAILLMVPRTARFGALTLGVVMLGAAATHLRHGEISNTLFTLGFAAAFAVIAYVRRARESRQQLAQPS